MATNPTLITTPFAESGDKTTPPNTNVPSDGRFSQTLGFPPVTAIPLGSGGKAPKREDFNGALNMLSNIAYYAQKGWQFQFDASQNYFAGCIVRDTTDGKLYECLNDVAAGGSVPSADTTNWKESGVDPSMFANPNLSNLSATGENHFLVRDFTIIYPNGGTEAYPANVTTNTRYVETNPFSGYYIRCSAEILYNGKWGESPDAGNPGSGSNSYGLMAFDFDGSIVIQTGVTALASLSKQTINPFGITSSNPITSAPCRVKVWKIGKI